jgi:hypothetical protein
LSSVIWIFKIMTEEDCTQKWLFPKPRRVVHGDFDEVVNHCSKPRQGLSSTQPNTETNDQGSPREASNEANTEMKDHNATAKEQQTIGSASSRSEQLEDWR